MNLTLNCKIAYFAGVLSAGIVVWFFTPYLMDSPYEHRVKLIDAKVDKLQMKMQLSDKQREDLRLDFLHMSHDNLCKNLVLPLSDCRDVIDRNLKEPEPLTDPAETEKVDIQRKG